jgi:drug/metabolite transporter (DMT)-like permease
MSWLVNHWSVTRTAYVTVVVPIVALTLGAVARHEPLGASTFGGAALVLGGLLVGMRPARP